MFCNYVTTFHYKPNKSKIKDIFLSLISSSTLPQKYNSPANYLAQAQFNIACSRGTIVFVKVGKGKILTLLFCICPNEWCYAFMLKGHTGSTTFSLAACSPLLQSSMLSNTNASLRARCML